MAVRGLLVLQQALHSLRWLWDPPVSGLAGAGCWLRPVLPQPPAAPVEKVQSLLNQGVAGAQCPAPFVLTPSRPLQVSQGTTPACPQRGRCGCAQPGSYRGPRGGGVPRWHKPAAAAAPLGGRFWLPRGLRERAPGLRYVAPLSGPADPGPQTAVWWLLAVVRGFFWSWAVQRSSGLRDPLIDRMGVLPAAGPSEDSRGCQRGSCWQAGLHCPSAVC